MATKSIRIAVAGFQHETNSFGIGQAGLKEFEMADSWPEMLLGESVVSVPQGMNLPIAGFIKEAERHKDVDVRPILWCAAEPSGPVTDEAFEIISEKILAGLAQDTSVDGVYLDLHGAMITQSFDDGEGELLRRIRNFLGADIPIVISLDLHANITQEMVDLADGIAIFRTYPHLDMADTGTRCYSKLLNRIRGERLLKDFRQGEYLIPLHAQCTDEGPAKRLYEAVEELEKELQVEVDLALGFTAADIYDCGPSIVVYGSDKNRVHEAADRLSKILEDSEAQFDATLLSPLEAVNLAQSNAQFPTIIADVQDNPGAGASSNSTGLLKALVESKARGAIVGLHYEPEVAKLAHKVGVGSTFEANLGVSELLGQSNIFEGKFRVEQIGDGTCVYSGRMYGGGVATLGPTAVLRVVDPDSDIQIVVTSIRNQCLDLAHFTHIGLDPSSARIIGVKSTAHFRDAFAEVAQSILLIEASGAFPCNLKGIKFQNLRNGIRLGPNGPVHQSLEKEHII